MNILEGTRRIVNVLCIVGALIGCYIGWQQSEDSGMPGLRLLLAAGGALLGYFIPLFVWIAICYILAGFLEDR